MCFRTIYLPTLCTYTLQDADAYIRSAFVIPKNAEATQDYTLFSTGVLVVAYMYKGEYIARFTCYPMSAHKPGKCGI